MQGRGGDLVSGQKGKRTKIKKSENKLNEEKQILAFYCIIGYLSSFTKCYKKGN